MTHAQPMAEGASPRATITERLRHFFAYDRRALSVLLACVLSMVGAALDPPFLSLTSDAAQNVLQATESRIPLLIAVGFLALAVITLIAGALGDMFGRRRLLLGGLSALVVTNALSAFTVGSLAHVPVFVLKTVAVGVVTPMCVAIVTLAFDRSLRPFAFGMLFGAQTLALLASSILKWLAGLSGVLWWSYAPVVIVGLIAMWQVGRRVPESDSRTQARHPSVWLNLFLLALTFVLIFVLLTGRTLLRDWSLVGIAVGVLAVVMTSRYWLRSLSRELNKIVDDHVFTNRELVLAIAAGVIISGVQIAFLFEFGTFSREVQLTGSLVANLRLLPYVVGVLAGSIMIQQLSVRFGAPLCVAGGMGLMALSLLALALIQSATPFWLIVLPIMALGFGYGVATPARAQVILSSAPMALVGVSAAIKTAASQLGNALGITTATVVITQLTNTAYLATMQALGAGQAVLDQVQQSLPDALTQAAETAYAIPATAVEIVTPGVMPSYADAWTSGMSRLFLWLGIATLIGAGAIYIVMVRRAQTPPRSAAVVSPAPNSALDQTEASP